MEKDKQGFFRTQVELEDGEHQYKFRIRSKSWFLEPDQWVDIVGPYAIEVIDDSAQKGIVRLKNGQKIINREQGIGYYKGLIELRPQKSVFYPEKMEFFPENPDTKVLTFTWWNDEGDRVVVVANFSNNYLAGYTVPNFPADETWHEWIRNYDLEVNERQLIIDLPEYSAQVFIKINF